MPGPWIYFKENLEFYQDFKVETGEYYETQQYDGEKHPQGYALWQVRSLEEANKDGAWISARLVAVSDGHLQWWMDNGPGKAQKRKFMLHLCTKDVGGCRRGRGHGPLEFHCDHFRVLSASDITDLRVSWFKEKVAKDDVKAEIEKLTGHEKVAPKRGSRKRPLEESTSDRDVERIPAEAEHPAGSGAVAEDLKKVRAEVDKEKRRDDENKDAHRRRRERPQHDEREKEKAKVKEREKEKEKEKKVKKPDRKAQDKGNWFGQKGEPQHSASESMDTKSDDTPRKAKRKKRKRRRAKQGDRGPFGVGRRVKFGEDESSEASKGSKSDGSGQVFQAAPSEKSRQLQLIEYSQQYPGRLAARLLTKMQDLLAREEGAMNPVGQNQTPATATSYYLTVVAPS